MRIFQLCTVSLLVAVLVLHSTVVFAADSSFLTEKIIQSVEHIKHNNEQNKIQEEKDKAYLVGLVQQKRRAEAANDAKEVHNIQQRYYNARAKMLYSWSWMVTENEKDLVEISHCLEQLQKQHNIAEHASRIRYAAACKTTIKAILNNYRLTISGDDTSAQEWDSSASSILSEVDKYLKRSYHSNNSPELALSMDMVRNALTLTANSKMNLRKLHGKLMRVGSSKIDTCINLCAASRLLGNG